MRFATRRSRLRRRTFAFLCIREEIRRTLSNGLPVWGKPHLFAAASVAVRPISPFAFAGRFRFPPPFCPVFFPFRFLPLPRVPGEDNKKGRRASASNSPRPVGALFSGQKTDDFMQKPHYFLARSSLIDGRDGPRCRFAYRRFQTEKRTRWRKGFS